MKSRIKAMFLYALVGLMALTSLVPLEAQEANKSVPVTMTVTANVASDKRMPVINQDDVVVNQGKERVQVTDWVPAKGDRAAWSCSC